MLSVMIMIAGVLVVLPRLGVRLPVTWFRVISAEVAFAAFLAVLHLLAHDPEPRALARSGQAGGFVGYIVSWPFFKLFGTGMALFLFVTLIVIAFGYALGLRRKSLRTFLLFTSKQFELFAER